MLEREITDAGFVHRWAIVRTLMPQSIAEHSFFVAVYANDMAIALGVTDVIKLAVVQYALWHDMKDEIFTGDSPGPAKRALFEAMGEGTKERYDAKVDEWANRTFANLDTRSGRAYPEAAYIAKLIVKAADWLEAAVRMATEHQMGNGNTRRHIQPNLNGCLETLDKVCEAMGGEVIVDEVPLYELSGVTGAVHRLKTACEQLVGAAACGLSHGPWITGEDERR